MKNWKWYAVLFLGLSACAGTQRGCASSCASELGADWVIIQSTTAGEPFRCWMLHDESVGNEPNTDGIYWQSTDGHLVHLSGFYTRIQVSNGEWASALAEVGLTEETCAAIQARSTSRGAQ